MCKSIKSSFESKLSFIKLLEAHEIASKGKRSYKEVMLFELDLESNLVNILKDLKNDNYKFGKYREFIIYEPKKRLIKSLPYRDRIVHQWYVEEFIKPFYSKVFIKDTYACLEDKGTHKAVKNLQHYMKKIYSKNKNYYVLKCDIKKYFYSIDKDILMGILKRRIRCEKLINFTKVILNDGTNIGIPIGNYTSQYFANIYLNEFDHFIKEKLKVKYYIRYMDDFIILVENKEKAKNILKVIRKYLKNDLHLELNSKCKYYPSNKGINFCGYVIFNDYILLRKRFKKKFRKNIRLWKKLHGTNKLNYKKARLSYNSFKAHASHCNSFFIKKVKELLK